MAGRSLAAEPERQDESRRDVWKHLKEQGQVSLVFTAPVCGQKHHLEILNFDPETGFPIPELEGRLTVLNESDEEVDSQPLRLYYAQSYHYANNFSIPEGGAYALRTELEPPDFNRHGSEDGEGRAFTEPVVVEFENVEIST